ncbi:MAG: energy transducer TonB [Pseudomonadota bacterium]
MNAFSVLPIAGVLIATATLPSAGVKVSPSGKWVLDYAATSCILARDRVGDQSGVVFQTRPLAEEHDLLLMLPPTGGKWIEQMGNLQAGAKTGEHWVIAGEPKGSTSRLVDTQITTDEMAAAITAGSLRLSVGTRLDATVHLPGMAGAMAALRKCEDDLAKRWQVEHGWVVPPKGDLRGLFLHNDYPLGAIRRGSKGSVRVLLSIDQRGSPHACKVIESSGDADLDAVTCNVYRKRAQFTPALDAEGKAVAGKVLAPRVRWETR